MLPPTPLLLLGALVSAGHAAALVGGRLGWPAAPLRTRAIPATLATRAMATTIVLVLYTAFI